jgi:2-polyprenyl-6-methoxyphenol hydroxylase-like FAD-dependent oxidoreductase
MSTTDYDVVIVGAGLAGCAAAIHYGRRGARVALIDRNPDPRAYKVVCSTYIQASATPALQRLGLAERIEAAGGVRNGIDIWSRWGWIRPQPGGPGPATHGYNIRRETLDPMVREMAAGTPGVEMLLGHAARALLTDGRRVTGVQTAGTAGERSLRARLVVAADGRG